MNGVATAVPEDAPPRETEPAATPSRVPALLAAVFLGSWCLIGAWSMVDHLLAAHGGLRIERPAEAAGVVGMPLHGAGEVTALRALVDGVPSPVAEPWLVVFPPEAPGHLLQYTRAQLAYWEYPRRIDVIVTGQQAPGSGYGVVVTHAAVGGGGGGAPVAAVGGFSAYRTAP